MTPHAVLVALATLVATHAAAQIVPTGTPSADILLSRGIAEHRIFLTCSAFDPATHAQILANWQREVTDATAILAANAVPAEVIAAFQNTAEPANLLPKDDTPFADVKQLCDSNPDWQTRYALANRARLDLQLPQAFE
jgi:hypothetical protein